LIGVAGVTFISRVLGYIRDLAIAFFLGAGVLNDVFIIALRLPNMLRTIFGEGALNAAFVPIFAKIYEKDGLVKARIFVANTQTILLALLLAICGLAICNMETLVTLIAPGYRYSTEILALTTTLARISFIYILFISIMVLYGGICNTFGSYLPFACTSIIMNISLLVFVVLGNTDLERIYWLTTSLPIAGLLEMLWMMFFVWKKMGVIGLCKPCFDQNIRALCIKMLPGIGSAGISQLNIFLSTIIASFTTGGISYLYYADRVYQLPLALIGTALGSVMLSELSKAFASADYTTFSKLQKQSIHLVLLITMPVGMGLALEAYGITELLFQRGAFNSEDTLYTSAALEIFAIGIPFYSLHKIASSAFFAMGNTRLPMIVGAISLMINIAFSLTLLPFLQHCAVAAGSVAAFAFSSITLFICLRTRGVISFTTQDVFYATLSFILTIICGLVIWCLQVVIEAFIWRIVAYLILALAAAAMAWWQRRNLVYKNL
jgi:putative peptidoglycan lipid II flippase